MTNAAFGKKVLAIVGLACLCAALLAVPAYGFYYVHDDSVSDSSDGLGAYEVFMVVDETAVGGDVHSDLMFVPAGSTADVVLNEGIISSENQAGLDAMNAALIAMHAVDVQRESFRDQDTIRVHGRLSKGAEAANIIAEDVRLEYSVRGRTIPAYLDAAKKLDRSMRAGAVATGCGVTIRTLPGNLPIVPVKDAGVMAEVLGLVCGDTPVTCTGPDFHSTSSGDYGDVSCLMPLLQFNTGGFRGAFHSPDVEEDDPYEAYVVPAKIFALTAYRLLRSGADRAKSILEEFRPTLTREQYLELMEGMLSEERVEPQPLPPLDPASTVV